MRTKRILSILLSLVLVLGMLPGISLTASAADTTTTITSPATTGTMTITLTIAAASVKTAPAANTLTYSGSAQTLTTTGEAGVGTLQYQLGESATTEPTGTWETTVPQGTEAKDYYVWYRSRVNDDNISTAGCKTVTIAKASITNATVTLSNTSLVYNGSEQSVTVSSVKLGDTTLTADTDYEVTSGTTGTAKNTYTVTVTGKGNYKDTATAQWSIGLATPTIETIPTASAITYGQKLADSTLTGGVAKLGDTTVAGTFAWKNTETKPAVFDSNATEYDVVFTPTDADNYAAVECKVKLTVNKAAPTVTAPTAKTLTYTGSAQELVNAGSTGDGKLYYGVTTENTAPTDESLYTTSIPTATNAGTYYVWYKIAGDENHNDTEPACVEATINKATPSYTAPTGLVATYGDTLSSISLPTGWAWADSTASVGNAGTNIFAATFTPDDTDNYNTVEQNLSVTVGKATPSYTAPTDLVATYGDTLSSISLPTGWAWADGTASVGNAGTNTFAATFTPEDTANYNTVEQNLSVTVNANDKTALIAAIGSASEYYNSISSEHPDIAATLQNAIDVATSVKNDDKKTEAEISDAVTALNGAVDQAKADENQAKIDAVKTLITAIGTVEYTNESKGKIDAAKAAYEALTPEQKELVTNYSVLTVAEQTYAEKEAEATAKKGLPGGVIALIVILCVLVVGCGAFAIVWFAVKKKTWAEFVSIFKKK